MYTFAHLSKSVIDQEFYNSREEAEVVGFQFPVEVNQTAIAGYTGTAKDITIPSRIKINGNFKEVTQIRQNAFEGKGLNSIILPNNFVRIQQSSFSNNNLKKIVIPDKVTQIHNSAFKNNQLTEVKLPDKVDLKIDAFAFENNQIKSITIPSNVHTIEWQVFDNNGLKKITIENRSNPLNFKVDKREPVGGWKTGTYNLNGEKWIKE